MVRGVRSLVVVLTVVVASEAWAQGVGVPLQLSPGQAPARAPQASAKIPNNWKIIAGDPDPLTGQGSRKAMTLPKATPVIDGKSVETALVMQCSTSVKGMPDPQLIVIFTSLTGVGHFKNFGGRYRFDEGPVHEFSAESVIGKNHARAIPLPEVLDASDLQDLLKLHAGVHTEVDPGVEIAGAMRLRIEFNFKSAGVIFLDFNVSGATQVVSALGCQ
jgi:hypothetical protein